MVFNTYMNDTTTTNRTQPRDARQDCGAIDASKAHGNLPVVSLGCEHCGHEHTFEFQGLRAVSLHCDTVKMLDLDELISATAQMEA